VASVEVSPNAFGLDVGGTKQLDVTLRDADGNVLTGRAVSWTTSDVVVAAVSGGGLETALAAGSATITATSEGVNGTSAASVTAPVPSAGGGAYPNEPVGFLAVTERSYLATVEDGWTATTAGGFSIVSDATAPKSPSAVGQMVYPAGSSDLDPGWTEYPSLAGLGYTRLYLSFWVKLSANWQGHKTSVNKIGYVWVHDKPVVFPLVQGVGSAPLHTAVGLQDIPNLVAVTEAPNLGTVEIVRGQWHRWELVLVMNTGSNADGELHWWIDGVKVGEYKNIEYGDATQGKLWQDPCWRPIWGGQGDTLVQTQYMWMDHYYASGGN